MTDYYVGEIKLFAGNYAPDGWHFCDGSLLDVSQNQMLFSLIGTTYGGNGATTFGIPDLRGRVPVCQGVGPGTPNLTPRVIGQKGGAEMVVIDSSSIPAHNHTLSVSKDNATSTTPKDNVFAQVVVQGSHTGMYLPTSKGGTTITAAPEMLAQAGMGTGVSHDNCMPTMALTYMIALNGLYPTRS